MRSDPTTRKPIPAAQNPAISQSIFFMMLLRIPRKLAYTNSSLDADGVDGGGTALIEKYSDLREPNLRTPFEGDGVWLVRPDGYLAWATRHGRWDEVEQHLEVIKQHLLPPLLVGPVRS